MNQEKSIIIEVEIKACGIKGPGNMPLKIPVNLLIDSEGRPKDACLAVPVDLNDHLQLNELLALSDCPKKS